MPYILSEAYEKYLENMYSAEDESASNNAKSGKISVIILSAIIVFSFTNCKLFLISSMLDFSSIFFSACNCSNEESNSSLLKPSFF